jgi:hypothetical protein
MNKIFWTEEKDALLRRDYPTKHLGSLAVRLGTTVIAVKTRARKLGLRREVNVHHLWTDSQVAYLKKHYADATLDELIRHTCHCQDSIYTKAAALGLRKSKAFLQAVGRHAAASPRSQACRFKKGQEPFNKGRREHEFRSKDAIARCAATQFKAGHRPHNTRPVGYECIRMVKGKGYIYIKVSDGDPMMMKHRWLWEQANGPIPEGCIIIFRDGDTHNCSLENLELVSREEHARRIIMNESPETRKIRCDRARDARNRLIRRDKARIHFGLEPKSKLVKRW